MEMVMEKANSREAPVMSQMPPARRASAMTTGTKTADTRSAMRAIGALDPLASSTRRISWRMVVSSPTRVAVKRIVPSMLSVPEVTVSPVVFAMGMDSPVTADSSTLVAPSVTVPSTGMRAPGRTMTVSPRARDAAGIVTSRPSRRTVASAGASCMSALSAPVVCPLARASRYFPTVISVTIMPADSK